MTQSYADPITTVLIVDDQEWTSRSVESILRPRGFAVIKAYTGRQALELAGRARPDLGIIDFHLPDMNGIEVVRELRTRKILDSVTPLLMTTSSGAGRAERLEALSAGAWDILRHPLDPGELMLRMDNLIRAKHEADRLRDEIITDVGTGLYNVRGVLRRAREMRASSRRFGTPIACIAVGPGRPVDTAEGDAALTQGPTLADLLPGAARVVQSTVREYDAVGQMGPCEFVIVATGLDQTAAVRLADRILENLERTPGADETCKAAEEGWSLRAGVYVTAADEATDVDPENLLSRATTALRRAQTTKDNFKVRPFEA
jgi:PleD family two-component response regulator